MSCSDDNDNFKVKTNLGKVVRNQEVEPLDYYWVWARQGAESATNTGMHFLLYKMY